MADNVVLSAAVGTGATVATDECTVNSISVHVPLGKLGYGSLDSFTMVTASAGLPVQQQTSSTFEVVGDAAHDAAAAGNPVLLGGYASASAPTAVSDADVARLWVTTAGALNVADAGGSLTVDGTVAATQSGSWTVTGAGGTFPVTDSSGSLTVDAPVGTPVFVRLSDGSAAISTLPVSLASVPSHAVTNAGTFAVQVDGAVLTSLQLLDNLVLAEDAGHGSGDPGVMALAVRRDTASAVAADGDYIPLTTDSSGRLHVNVGNSLTVGSHDVTNAGTFAVQAAQSGTWNVGTVTAVTSVTNPVAVTDNSGSLTVDAPVGTPAFVRLSDGASPISTLPVSLASVPSHDVTNAGTFAVQSAQSGTWTVQPGNTPNSSPWLVSDRAATSGGLSMHKRISTASTNAVNVKGSAGQVYSVQVMNNTSAAKYLKLYNTASAPSVGSDTPAKVLLVPGNTAGAGLVINWDKGLAFGTGISFATTTGIADSDTGAVGANEMTVNLDYV